MAAVPIQTPNILTRIFYVAFMFSPIYLRLLDHVPPQFDLD